MSNEKEREEFIAILKHYGLFQPLTKYKCICPFHSDVGPSMQINLDTNTFYCYGCLKRGGSNEFIKLMNPSYTPFEVVKTIKAISRGSAGKYSKESFVIVDKTLNMGAVRDYYYNLPEVNWYKTDDDCKAYMKKRGFKMSTLNSAGARINATDYYKVVFPIRDNGVFRGYVARTTNPEIEKKRKYMYNTGFRRSKTLAGTYTSDSVLVVEGFLDMLKAMQCGVKQVVAILGWFMSEQQEEKLLHRGVKTIICGLDNDDAGKKGYERLKKQGKFNVIRLRYPKGIKDFGDVTEEAFDKRILEQIKKYEIMED